MAGAVFRRLLVGATSGAVLAGLGAWQPDGAATNPRAAAHQVQIFQYTGIQRQFQVPSGVTSLDVIAYGARGGAGVAGQHGGAGTPARVATTLPVTPRETLYIVVGGRGADSDSSSRDGCGNYKCLFAAGGWGGGGASGLIPDVGQPAPLSGGGGGGASDVRTKPMG